MYVVEVKLALISINQIDSSKSRFCLTTNNQLPNKIMVENKTSLQSVTELYKQITGSDTDWFIVKQVGIEEDNGCVITILYSIMMPELVPLIDDSVHWVDYETVSKNPDSLYLFGRACNYHKANQ